MPNTGPSPRRDAGDVRALSREDLMELERIMAPELGRAPASPGGWRSPELQGPTTDRGVPIAAIDYARRVLPPTPTSDVMLQRLGPLAGVARGPLAPFTDHFMVGRGVQSREGDVKLEYQPMPFAGAEGLVQALQPPGFESFDTDVEYILKFDDMKVRDGDFSGVATEYWRGRPNKASIPNPGAINIGHGQHDEYIADPTKVLEPGASIGDRNSFDDLLRKGAAPFMSAVRHKGGANGGVTSFLISTDNLQHVPRYIPNAHLVGKGIMEVYLDDKGRQISREEAVDLIRAGREEYLEQNTNRKR